MHKFYASNGKRLEKPWKVAKETWKCELRFYRLVGLGAAAERAEAALLNAAMAGRPTTAGPRQRLWDLLEDPASSPHAKFLVAVGVFVIVLSIFTLCAETVWPHSANEYYDLEQAVLDFSGSGQTPLGPQTDSVVFKWIEFACIMYFSTEYLLRLYATDGKWRFITNKMNIIDVLAIAPWCIGLLVGGVDGFAVVRVVRLVRVFRIFRLGSQVQGLTVFKRTLIASMNELALLLFFVGLAVLLFGSIIYYVERFPDEVFHMRFPDGTYAERTGNWSHSNPIFTHVPHGFWWTLCTMTSLGYGEIYPSTYPGYIIGGIASISGLITLALPMVIIGQNFSETFRQVQLEVEDAADAEEATAARAVAKAKQMMRRTAAFKRAKSRFGGRANVSVGGGQPEGASSEPVRLGMRGRILSADHHFDEVPSEAVPVIARSSLASAAAPEEEEEGGSGLKLRPEADGAGDGTPAAGGIIMTPSGVVLAAEEDVDVGTP